MGILFFLLWVVQDLFHQPYAQLPLFRCDKPYKLQSRKMEFRV